MKTKPVTFSTQLQHLLDEAQITAYGLAKLTGLPAQTVSRYLHGREPTFGNALRIARALNQSMAVFDGITTE